MMRTILLTIAALLVLATVATPGAAAAPEPVGLCEPEATVDVCFPVCVDGPCWPYACVHNVAELCIRP